MATAVNTSGQQYFGFDPRTVPGCVLWLDGADRNVLFADAAGTIPASSPGSIGMWRDKSLSARHYIQSTTADRPTLVNNTITTANNTRQHLSNAATLAATGIDLFFVGKPHTNTPSRFRTLFRDSAATDLALLMEPTDFGSGTSLGYYTAAAFRSFSGVTLSGLTRTLIYVSYSASRVPSAATNGTIALSVGPNALTTNSQFNILGGRPDTEQPWGELNEVILVSNTTQAHRQQIEGYLAWKWGIQGSLPSVSQYGLSETSGLALWYDAADPSAVVLSGSNVSQWTDKSGNNRHATAGTSPAYNTAGINNLGVISFNGSSTFLNTVDVYTQRAFAVFFVVRRQGSFADTAPILGGSGNSTNRNLHLLWNANANRLRMGFWGNDLDFLNFPVYTGNTTTEPAYLIAMLYAPGTRQIFVNGALVASDTNSTNLIQFDGPTLGRFPAGNTFFNGFIGEFLTYNLASFPTEMRQNVEGYLAWKWGLQTTLPASHPFSPTVVVLGRPPSVPGLSLWLDAADQSTFTIPTGTKISQWRDKSLNAFHMSQATSGNQPDYSVDNGRFFVNFTAANTSFLSNTAMTIDYRTSQIFLVFRRKIALTNNAGIFSALTSTRTNGDWQNNDEFVITTFTEVASAGSGANDGQNGNLNPTTYSFVISNNNLTTFRDFGTTSVITRGMGLAAVPNSLFLGRRRDGTNLIPAELFLGEVIVYNRVLSATENRQIQDYLALKWALQINVPVAHSFKYNPPTMRVFRPIDIDTCRLWLDAADASTVQTSGANVVTWLDKSGSGLDFSQATTARQPTYSLNTLNGQNGILFTGAGTQGSATLSLSNAEFTLTQGAYSIFVVARQNASAPSFTGYNYILKGSLTDSFLFFGTHSSKNFATFTGPNATTWNDTNSNSPPVSTSNNPLLLGMVVSGSTLTPYYSGIAQTNKTGTTGAFTGMTLGDAPFPSFSGQNWNGVICEICIFNSALTTSQRLQLEGYLTDKWRVAALPTAHPYFDQRVLPSTPIFSPTAAPGLQVWLDSADPAVFTLSGSNVTQWRDKSGNNRHGTPPATSNQPTYNGNGVLFSGGGVQYLPLANISGILTNVAFNIFVVERNEGVYTATVTEGFFLGAETIVEGGALAIGYRATSTLRFSTFGAGNDLDATGLPTNTTTRLWSFNMPATSNRNMNLNGTLVATHGNTTKLNSSANLSVGRAFGGNYYRGRIYEILIYTTELSVFNRQRVEAYLAWKWGIQTLLPVASPPFTPLSLSGLALWYDAADSSAVVLSGSSVTQWTDKSGNSRHATGGTSPAYNTTGINNLGVISFNGSSTFLNTVDVYSQRAFAVFFVVRRQGSFADLAPILGGSDFSANRNLHLLWNANANRLRMGFYGNDLDFLNFPVYTGSPSTEPAYLITMSYTPGSRQIFVNGALVASDANSTNLISFTGPTLGLYSNQFFNGFIGEFIVYNTPSVTDEARRQVEGYLAQKWRLQINPAQITGLALWLDAADTSTVVTTGTTVTQWRDKSGNNRHLGVGSGTTTYTSNFVQLNSSFMSVTSDVNLQNFTLLVVCEAPTPVVGNQIIISARPNSGNDYSSTDAFGFYVDPGQNRLYGTLNTGQSITNALDPSTRFMTSYIGVSAGGLTSFQDGKAAGTAATGARGTTGRGFAIGASWNGTTHTDIRSTARIYEILVYTRALTLNERQQAEGYLAAKWGVPLSAFTLPTPFSGFRP